MAAQVAKKNLQHAGNRSPKIGLFGMVMNGFDRSGIGEGERDLNISCAVGHHSGSQSLSESGKLSKKSAVIRVTLQRLDAHTIDQIGRIRLGNYFSEGFFGPAADSQLDAI